jgi:lycopene cyclase CruA
MPRALLRVCGEKLRQAGGVIWDETEFIRADVSGREAVIKSQYLPTGEIKIK